MNDKIGNIALIISGVILSYVVSFSLAVSVIVVAVSCYLLWREGNVFGFWCDNLSRVVIVISCVFVGLTIFKLRFDSVCYYEWLERLLPNISHSVASLSLTVVSMLCGLMCFPVISLLFERVNFICRSWTLCLASIGGGVSKRDCLVIFVTSVISLTVCSECSPLYPTNHWIDPNVYFPIGNGLLDGLMPYRDLVDHKGPILYFIHAVSAMVCNRSMVGVWGFEMIYCMFFLHYGLKTVRLFDKNASSWFVVVLALMTYTATSFSCGDSCEELCLPLLTYTIFNGLKCTLLKRLPSVKETIVIGIFAGIIFWTKFVICAIFLGWFVVICIIAYVEEQPKSLLSIILLICLGLLIITIPTLGFYAYNGALDDLINIYILCNINYNPHSFAYDFNPSLLYAVISRLKYIVTCLSSSLLISLNLTFSFIFLSQLKNRKPLLTFALSILFPLITIIGIAGYNHYTFILSAFTPIGAFVLFKSFESYKSYKVKIGCLLFLIILFFGLSENTNDINLDRNNDPHYRFAKIINQRQDATLMEYRNRVGKDLYERIYGGENTCFGFYTATGIIPTCKHFSIIRASDIPRQLTFQDSMVNEGAFDFVVTTKPDFRCEYYSCTDSVEGYYLYEHK